MPPLAYNPTLLDGRQIAELNETQVLAAVRLFGHLRRTEIASVVWPKSSPASARLMCSRTVGRLLKGGFVVQRPNSLGGYSLVLSNKGAIRVQGETGLEASDGYDISNVEGPQFFHRTLGTSYLVSRRRQGATVFGEYAISKNWGPISRGALNERFHKYPDGLVLVPGSARRLAHSIRAADWIEVESSYKPDEELEKIFRIAWKTGTWLDVAETVVLDRVVFVYDIRQRHESAILAHLKRYLTAHPIEHPEAVLRSIRMARADISTPLVWRGVEELSAWDLLHEQF